MSDQTIPVSSIPADVRLFLAVVRRELADLDPEELTEITDGLEADLADLVAERGPSALGDPKAYAAELRTAAGITPTKKSGPRRSAGESVTGLLDASHAWFDHQVRRLPGDPKPVLDWLRPAWWVLRAWVAVQLVDLMLGGWPRGIIPSWNGLGVIVLGLAIFASIQLGRGKFWPGGKRALGARLALLGLNAFAIAVFLPVSGEVTQAREIYPTDGSSYNEGYNQAMQEVGREKGGLLLNGKAVTNIYPYDSQGRRMAGVQLFDQDGKPINASGQTICPDPSAEGGMRAVPAEELVDECTDYENGGTLPALVIYPWTNGQAQLLNVFPLAMREQDSTKPSATAFQEKDAPTLGEWPFGEVPRVSLPGITSGILATVKGSEVQDDAGTKAGTQPAE